ncbi:hypothetical protein NQ176_g5303 [Zarea fungicola]|uniref:Uncharacterized protein n=1 Tax=Zarea fungicola TaxID=93591 RepID=A0ACC1NBF1_9HYPO|nr:hypothetical protein NQ176_g5303 [Lecanicillium fungicola]
MSATFHPFPRLPVELRTLVWGLAIEPRIVDVRAIQGSRSSRGPSRDIGNVRAYSDPFIPTPVPGVMHACQESRNQGLYERVPYTLSSDPPEERYAWINFDKDMIDLQQGQLKLVEHLKGRIHQLRFERCNCDDYWYYTESSNLCWFEKLEECHVVAVAGLELWEAAWEDYYWSCSKENLKFIEKEAGRILNAIELERMVDAEWDRSEYLEA